MTGVLGAIHLLHEGFVNLHLLAVETMLGEVFNVDFAEITKSDVQSEVAFLDADNLHAAEQFAAEVQAGGRSSHSTLHASLEELVAFHIIFFGLVANYIVGQRCLTQGIKVFLKFIVVAIVEEAKCASARGGVVDYFSHDSIVEVEVEFVAYANLAGGVNENVPQLMLGIEFAQQEHFYLGAGLFLISD